MLLIMGHCIIHELSRLLGTSYHALVVTLVSVFRPLSLPEAVLTKAFNVTESIEAD